MAQKNILKTSEPTSQTYTLDQLMEFGKKVLKNPNNISKRYVYRYFDNAVRGNAILYPGETDAVVSAPIDGCKAGLAVSMDSNLYGHHDPYSSGASAVAEAVRNVICVGARPIAVTDCLNYGNPQKPDVFFDFVEGVKGIADACNTLGFIPGEALPIISGNVSLYNESKNGSAVIPSPVILVAGKIEDYHAICTLQLREPNLNIYLIGERHSEFGGTQINNELALTNTPAPQVRFQEEATQNHLIHTLITDKKITACHDISAGGTWIALLEMLLGERGYAKVGASITLTQNPLTTLFSENGGYIIAVTDEHQSSVESALKSEKVHHQHLGKTTTEKSISITHNNDTQTITLDELNQYREASNN
jgi:phosphoribosylformylglycinamidine synthase